MTRHPITYDGNLVAIVGARRFWLLGPWLTGRTAGDPLVRFVTYMCLCHREVEEGRVEGPFSSELAERWARHALIDDADLFADEDRPASEIADRMNVPADQVTKRRAEMGLSSSE